MNKKIFFWLDADITTFCMSYYLQKKLDADFYAIIDITNRPKDFFKKQSLVKFKKSWFYHDHIKKNSKSIDIVYLKSIEEKYGINLWQIVCNDRIFNFYNEYYTFTRDEILSILEQECRLYEKILNDVKPDYLITPENTFRHHHLFYLMCKSLGIKIIMFNISNMKNFCYLSQKPRYLDNIETVNSTHNTFEELQKYLKDDSITVKLDKFNTNIKSSKFDLLKAAAQFLFNASITKQSHYTYFGRSRLRVLIKEIIFSLKRKYRKSFIDKNFTIEFKTDSSFVYFSLQTDPERSSLIAAPFYTNQIELVRNIAKSLPINFKLLVKEHPNQGPARGWRKISEYKEIMRIPNVTLIHPAASTEKLLKNCSLAISSGTTCFEAGFYSKPSITFADLGYVILPHIFKVETLDELPNTIRIALDTIVHVSDISKYLALIEKNSFEFNYLDFILSYQNWFYHGGNLVDVNIDESKMKDFLLEHKIPLENLADAHKEKINLNN